MKTLSRLTLTALAGACLVAVAQPAHADCVSCGPGGECFSVSPGFSGNCECRTRVVNGAAVCKPSGVCDPNDPTSCKADEFPQLIGSKSRIGKIQMPFLSTLAERDPLLAGAVWAGVAEANEGGSEVTGTIGRGGQGYTYRTKVKPMADGAVSLNIEVAEDGGGHRQEYEGVVLSGGRSGHFLKVGAKGRVPVFSWDNL